MRILLLFLASLTFAVAADQPPVATLWDIASSAPVSVAVPKGWRNFDNMAPTMVIYRQGDGINVPIADETGAPLQIGLTVEKFGISADTTALIAKMTAEGAKRDPRLESIGDGTFVPVTLSDRTEGTFFAKEFIKSVHRRSLQMKLVVKDAETRVWVVSGYIVGGKDSRVPTPNSALALWLKAHMLSLAVGGQAIDPKPLEAAYSEGEPSAKPKSMHFAPPLFFKMKLHTETFDRTETGEGWFLSKTRGGFEKIEDKALELQKLAHGKGYYCICGAIDEDEYRLYLLPQKGVRYVIEKFRVGSHAEVEPERVYAQIAAADAQNPLVPYFADKAGLKARFSKPITEELIALLEDTLVNVEPMMDEDEGTIEGYIRQHQGLHLWWD